MTIKKRLEELEKRKGPKSKRFVIIDNQDGVRREGDRVITPEEFAQLEADPGVLVIEVIHAPIS